MSRKSFSKSNHVEAEQSFWTSFEKENRTCIPIHIKNILKLSDWENYLSELKESDFEEIEMFVRSVEYLELIYKIKPNMQSMLLADRNKILLDYFGKNNYENPTDFSFSILDKNFLKSMMSHAKKK